MTRLEIIVPVAPGEPTHIIEDSIDRLTGLDTPDGVETGLTYVVDRPGERQEELQQLATDDVAILFRDTTDGRRAGALMYALDQLDSPEYVAFMDIDVRPDTDFLTACLPALQQDEDCKLVTGERYITNKGESLTTRMVEQGYRFLNDQQRIAQYVRTYNHTNGCNGILEYDAVDELGFNTDQLTPDVDFTERMYRNGWHMRIVFDTGIGEQAPFTVSDFYSQQKRWMGGATENLLRHYRRFLRARPRIALGWYAQLLFPYIAVLFLPLVPLYAFRTADSYLRDMPLLAVYLVVYWFTSVLMLATILAGRTQDWVTPERSQAE